VVLEELQRLLLLLASLARAMQLDSLLDATYLMQAVMMRLD
jgi:hypothetical protein